MPDGALGLGRAKSAGSRTMRKVPSRFLTGLRARGNGIVLPLILTALGFFSNPSEVSAQDLLIQLSNSESSAPISGAMITVQKLHRPLWTGPLRPTDSRTLSDSS